MLSFRSTTVVLLCSGVLFGALVMASSATAGTVLYSVDAATDHLVTIDVQSLAVTPASMPLGVDVGVCDALVAISETELLAIFSSLDRTLYTIDIATGVATACGAYTDFMEALARNPQTGVVYVARGSNPPSSDQLLEVNIALGCSLSAPCDLALDMDALTYTASGQLVSVDVTHHPPSLYDFYLVNRAECSHGAASSPPNPLEFRIHDIAASCTPDYLWALAEPNNTTNERYLCRIDAVTGEIAIGDARLIPGYSGNGLAAPLSDCNGNGVPDSCDIANCTGDPACADCNGNGVPDACDISAYPGTPACADCNGNGVPDGCDIRATPFLYGINGETDELVKVDTTTCAVEIVGPLGVDFDIVTAMTTISPTKLLAIRVKYADAPNIYTFCEIDALTGLAATPVPAAECTTGHNIFEGMSRHPVTGQVWVSGGSSLGIVNLANQPCTATEVCNYEFQYPQLDMDSIAFDPLASLFGYDSGNAYYSVSQVDCGPVVRLDPGDVPVGGNIVFAHNGTLLGIGTIADGDPYHHFLFELNLSDGQILRTICQLPGAVSQQTNIHPLSGYAVPQMDCNGNGIPDECDIANCPIGDFACGDCDGDGVPNECDDVCPPTGLKNRYISFAPGTGAQVAALRVDKITSPTGSWWVDVPDAEGKAGCVSTPTFRVWPEPVIHAGDCEIVPVARYEVRATTDGVIFDSPRRVDTIAQPVPKFWADTVGAFGNLVAGQWDPPNGVVNVNDYVAALQKFLGVATAPHVTVVDVQSVSSTDPCLNRVVNIADVFLIIKAFQGNMYPFETNPANCPPCP